MEILVLLFCIKTYFFKRLLWSPQHPGALERTPNRAWERKAGVLHPTSVYLNASGMWVIWDGMLVGGLEMPSDQSEMLECGEELDHWSGDSGDGVRKGCSGTCSWWLGVLSTGEDE